MVKPACLIALVAIAASAANAGMGQILASWSAPPYETVNGIAFEGEYIWLKHNPCEFGGVFKCTKNGSTVNSISFPYHGYRESHGLVFDGQYLWTIYHQPSGTPTYDWYVKYTTNGSYAGDFELHPGRSGYSISISWDGQYMWTDERYYPPTEAGKYTTAGSLVGTFPISQVWRTDAAYYNNQLWAGGGDGNIYGMRIGGGVVASFAAPGGSCRAVGFDGEYLWTADGNRPQYIYKVDIDVVTVAPASFGKIKATFR